MTRVILWTTPSTLGEFHTSLPAPASFIHLLLAPDACAVQSIIDNFWILRLHVHVHMP